MDSKPVAVTKTLNIAPVSTKVFLDFHKNIESGFTLKRVCDMIKTNSQMHRTDKYSLLRWIISSVWSNGSMFVYELCGCGLKTRCSDLNFEYPPCFEQGTSWLSNKYRVWIHSEMRTWHNNNIQSNAPYICVLATQVNHLVSLAKWLSVLLQTKWLWVPVFFQSLKDRVWIHS